MITISKYYRSVVQDMISTLYKATSLLLLLPSLAFGAIGEVTDYSGSGAIERDDGFEILESRRTNLV